MSLPYEVWRRVQELRRQKQKYWSKTLSDDAIAINWERGLDVQTFTIEIGWDYIIDFNLTEISLSISLSIPPIEFEFLPMAWDIELPDWAELLAGILIKFEPVDLTAEFPWLKDLEALVYDLYPDWLAERILSSAMQKCVYDRARYDYCYYDPPLVMELIKRWFVKAFGTYRTLASLRAELEAAKEVEPFNPWVAALPIHRAELLRDLSRACFVLGLSRLGEAPVTWECEGEADNVYLGRMRTRYTSLDDAMLGMVLGFVPLGFGFLIPEGGAMRLKDVQVTPEITYHYEPDVWRLARRKVSIFVSQLSASALGFANWQAAEERRDWARSHRTELYAYQRSKVIIVEEVARQVLAQHGISGPDARKYISAALDLVSARRRRHGAGLRPFKEMAREDWFRVWLERWKRLGLDEDVLLDIADRVLAYAARALDEARVEAVRTRIHRKLRASIIRSLGRAV